MPYVGQWYLLAALWEVGSQASQARAYRVESLQVLLASAKVRTVRKLLHDLRRQHKPCARSTRSRACVRSCMRACVRARVHARLHRYLHNSYAHFDARASPVRDIVAWYPTAARYPARRARLCAQPSPMDCAHTAHAPRRTRLSSLNSAAHRSCTSGAEIAGQTNLRTGALRFPLGPFALSRLGRLHFPAWAAYTFPLGPFTLSRLAVAPPALHRSRTSGSPPSLPPG